MNTKAVFVPLIGLAMGLGLQSAASAARVSITIDNLTPSGGLYFTPVWVGFHDGSFDSFNSGEAASASIEAIAEGGDVSGLRADFAAAGGAVDGVVTAPDGFAGAPVFDPSDSASITLELDAGSSRYFSFASMVIPSNDAFIGNDDPMAFEIFDATGAFAGPLDIIVAGSWIWDAGTELNDGLGAAFSALGGTSTDENELIGAHTGLGVLLGSMTVAGTVIDPVTGDFTQPGYQLARISIKEVPEPGTLAMFGFGLSLVLIGRVRRSTRVGLDRRIHSGRTA